MGRGKKYQPEQVVNLLRQIEVAVANISDMATGNKFLPGFLERFNEKFALAPATAENLHRKLNVQASRLTDILCHRELRHVSQQLSLAYDRRQILLERSESADKLPGEYVEVYDFADRPLEVRWKGHLLPYRVFSKDQRVSHTATVENKRLGHALRIVRTQQELSKRVTFPSGLLIYGLVVWLSVYLF